MADNGFDTQTNEQGQHRWVYNSPGGAEYLGPTWHKSRAAAIRAGKDWLKQREEKA